MTEFALQTQNLSKSFGAVDVLKTIDIAMAKGDFLVLVGPSGCGKSTLLNCIAGMEEISAGRVHINGRDVTQLPPKDRDIAMVFQSYALYPTMTVAGNIGFGMKIRGLPKSEIQSKTNEVARLLQIQHLLDRKPAQLSGGQRQRVAMGRALVRDPALFLFDVPLSNLDAKLRVEMRAEIKRLHRETGASIVYVTHDQIEAMTLATQIVVLKDGIVQQMGSPDEIYDRPANAFVADFMGSPPMNLIPATVNGRRVEFAAGQGVEVGELPAQVATGQPVTVGIRPEQFHLAPGTVLQVTPTLIENAGSDAYVTFPLGEAHVTARFPGRFAGDEGQEITIGLTPGALAYFDPATGLRLG